MDSSSRDVLLQTQAASFGYGAGDILSGVTLSVCAGDLIGIVGPNGAGKTTLFRGLLGLVPASAGSVTRSKHPIGYVPQREELDPVYPLTVREIVAMGAYGRVSGLRALWRAPSRTEASLVSECLSAVGLPGLERELFAALSGGQRQRVLIARALMTKPRLLMLDEPTAGVDRKASHEILQLIGELSREHAIAVLMVAHQLDQVAEFAQDVLLVRDGGVTRGPSSAILAPEARDSLFGSASNQREG